VVAVPYFVSARVSANLPAESLAMIANSLAPSARRRIHWGRGTKGPLEARFAALPVRTPKSRSERWLLCQESIIDGERQYYSSNLPPTMPLTTLVRARSRWAIEVQYRDLKSELGLDHFEGRSPAGIIMRSSPR
jgi:SRSO17 transposase